MKKVKTYRATGIDKAGKEHEVFFPVNEGEILEQEADMEFWTRGIKLAEITLIEYLEQEA
jgi:hypothetical protein